MPDETDLSTGYQPAWQVGGRGLDAPLPSDAGVLGPQESRIDFQAIEPDNAAMPAQGLGDPASPGGGGGVGSGTLTARYIDPTGGSPSAATGVFVTA